VTLSSNTRWQRGIDDAWWPPCRVLISFLMQRGGAFPSLLHSCHFNMMERAPALPIVFSFSMRRGVEGYAPPHHVLAMPSLLCSSFLFDVTRRGAHTPSLSCSSHCNAPPPRVVALILTQRGGAMSLPVAFFSFGHDREGTTLSVVFFLFSF